MNFASIQSQLKATRDTSWRAVINDDRFRLLGWPLAIEIQTRSIPDESPLPEITAEESQLADMILNGLETVIAESERLLEDDPAIEHLRGNGDAVIVTPHIWISSETLMENGPTRWPMVLEIDVNPDFGWHIEFDGLTALEIWAGD